MTSFTVNFIDSDKPAVSLQKGAKLAEHLDATNSPLLFGCRTGICGTCLVRVQGQIEPADADEEEVLEIFAPNDPEARLACQLRCNGDIVIGPHPDAP